MHLSKNVFIIMQTIHTINYYYHLIVVWLFIVRMIFIIFIKVKGVIAHSQTVIRINKTTSFLILLLRELISSSNIEKKAHTDISYQIELRCSKIEVSMYAWSFFDIYLNFHDKISEKFTPFFPNSVVTYWIIGKKFSYYAFLNPSGADMKLYSTFYSPFVFLIPPWILKMTEYHCLKASQL